MTISNAPDAPDVEKIVNELCSRIPFDRTEAEHLRWMAARFQAGLFLRMLRLSQQFEQERSGNSMHNRVNPNELNELARRIGPGACRDDWALHIR